MFRKARPTEFQPAATRRVDLPAIVGFAVAGAWLGVALLIVLFR